VHSVTDRQTDRRTDDMMMPIADHRLKISISVMLSGILVRVLYNKLLNAEHHDHISRRWFCTFLTKSDTRQHTACRRWTRAFTARSVWPLNLSIACLRK